jgi:hypothetical protein
MFDTSSTRARFHTSTTDAPANAREEFPSEFSQGSAIKNSGETEKPLPCGKFSSAVRAKLC